MNTETIKSKQAIDQQPLLTDAERQKLLVDWNDTVTEYPSDQCVHQIFEQQVLQTPDSIAVVFEGQQLSYLELNQKANQLAHHLVTLGVKPETLVAICMDRSIDLIVGLVAILKAGAAYVPLDPSYPLERLSFMLDDTQAPLLISHKKQLSSLPEQYSGQLLLLDGDDITLIAQKPKSNPQIDTSTRHPAYIIYTSGSTGTPNGVVVPHQAINRLLLNTNYIQLTANDRIAQISNISFDAATFEVWGALLNGSQLIVLSKQQLLSIADLGQTLKNQGITTLFLTTALFNQVIETTTGAFSSLNYLLFGGETVNPHRVKQLLENKPPKRLLHVYGPTETTTFATYYEVTSVPKDALTIPIGKPLANSTAYILDEQMQPVPIGVAGELYLGGDGLALGYHNRPELTKQRFLRNPFGDKNSQLYKTGDRVRYLADGNIEFLGRFDNQVKIRGFRIELGEIETVLMQHEKIKQAVVMMREDNSGNKRLISYVILFDVRLKIEKELHDYLESKLPEYMVPYATIFLESFELTANGKVDRNALPEPVSVRPELTNAYLSPKTDEEVSIAKIWSEILNLEQIGIQDDFLELGGYSLLATQLLTRINKIYSLELSLSDFYTEPTIEAISRIIKQHKNKIIANGNTEIQAVSHTGLIPVTFSQGQVILLSQLAPESIAYHFQAAIHLTGQLNIEALKATINEIIRRHEIFRTVFVITDGIPQQNIKSPWHVSLAVEDLENIPEHQRKQRIDEIIANAMSAKFDIAELPLVRWKLLKLSQTEYILLQIEHHLVHDGWSFSVFLKEFKALYSAYSEGLCSPLIDLPVQFADYAIWQRKMLQGEKLQSLLEYWKNNLSGMTPVLDLPIDYQRADVQSFRGAEVVSNIPADCAKAMRQVSKEHGVTLFTFMLTTYFILLYRYTHQQDIVIGTGVANRNTKYSERLIGMIINTIPLRLNLADDLTFTELLAKVKTMSLNAYAHQELPFSKLVDELKLPRDLSRNAIFQTLFSFHDAQVTDLKFPELSGEIEYLYNTSAKFDINVIVIPWAEQSVSEEYAHKNHKITLKWEYATDLFESGSILRMTGHYQQLLNSIINNPDALISELSILPFNEQKLLNKDWNNTQADYPKHQCVHQIFEQQVLQTPNSIAVVFEEHQLSYFELNQKANQLAHHLITLGVKPETLVGICMDRSIDLVVGLLAIIKAGGAYVPLDPSYPLERLSFMLADTQVPVLMTHKKQLASVPEQYTGIVLTLDGDNIKLIAQKPKSNPQIDTSTRQAAYIIYTSGSTGTPNGVVVPHQAINRLLLNTNYVELTSNDRVAQVSNISFDAATFEVWGALLNGSQLIVLSKHRLLSMTELGQTFKNEGITTLFLTTALFNQVIESTPNAFSSLKQVLFGGEAVNPHRVKQLLENKPPNRLLHVYGPTETTTFATYYEVSNVPKDAVTIPIGKPLANSTAFILDKQMQPVPIGIVGELYLGGDGLALGYHNRPELTKQRFLPNPFGEKNTQLYKTGDRVCYLPDGNIEFLGRFDNQVKIRGFRIELGEIEAVLMQHEKVKQAVVMMQEDQPGNKRLVTYCVPQKHTPEIKDLRQYLKQKLPEYMLPSVFVFQDHFKLTPNGKVDRKVLLESHIAGVDISDDVLYSLDSAHLEPESSYVPPSTPEEVMLIKIWQEVLHINRISIHDNYFELGGHSLLAIVICSKIEKKINTPVPVKLIFQHPTVHQLSKVLEKQLAFNAEDFDSVYTAINTEGNEAPFFWVLSGPYIPLMHQHLGKNRPFYLLNYQSQDGKKAKYLSIKEMATFYIETIIKVVPQGPYNLGGYSIGAVLAYEIAKQLREQGKQVTFLFLLDPTGLKSTGTITTQLKSSFFKKYKTLKELGYIKALLSKFKQLKNKLQRLFDNITIRIFFKIGKPLSIRLIKLYIMPIYRLAGRNYQLTEIKEGIDKIVFVHVKNTEAKAWQDFLKNKVDDFVIDSTHHQLEEKNYALKWVKILAREIEQK